VASTILLCIAGYAVFTVWTVAAATRVACGGLMAAQV